MRNRMGSSSRFSTDEDSPPPDSRQGAGYIFAPKEKGTGRSCRLSNRHGHRPPNTAPVPRKIIPAAEFNSRLRTVRPKKSKSCSPRKESDRFPAKEFDGPQSANPTALADTESHFESTRSAGTQLIVKTVPLPRGRGLSGPKPLQQLPVFYERPASMKQPGEETSDRAIGLRRRRLYAPRTGRHRGDSSGRSLDPCLLREHGGVIVASGGKQRQTSRSSRFVDFDQKFMGTIDRRPRLDVRDRLRRQNERRADDGGVRTIAVRAVSSARGGIQVATERQGEDRHDAETSDS